MQMHHMKLACLARAEPYHINSSARSDPAYRGLFESAELARVDEYFRSRPQLLATPLRHLPGLAAEIGVRDVLLKDESVRFSLDAFKVLGVSYAAGRLLESGSLSSNSIVACATEGNHGRAVARVATGNRIRAKIYVPSASAGARADAIRREGAEVMVVEGSYDNAVRRVRLDAERHGWTIISDTSWPGYESVPRLIMAGYTRLLDEAEAQWDEPPDVVLVQAGVGGLACAVVSWLCRRYGARRPFTVVCEPSGAACLMESARIGRLASLDGPFETIMVGLRCGEASSAAWPAIAKAADAFVAVEDERCAEAVRLLARPRSGDHPVGAGASGACGLAALLAILQDEGLRPLREASGLGAHSRVLVINTEGVNDPALHAEIIGSLRRVAVAETGAGD